MKKVKTMTTQFSGKYVNPRETK